MPSPHSRSPQTLKENEQTTLRTRIKGDGFDRLKAIQHKATVRELERWLAPVVNDTKPKALTKKARAPKRT